MSKPRKKLIVEFRAIDSCVSGKGYLKAVYPVLKGFGFSCFESQ